MNFLKINICCRITTLINIEDEYNLTNRKLERRINGIRNFGLLLL